MVDGPEKERMRVQMVGALCGEIIGANTLNPFEVAQCVIILYAMDFEQLVLLFKGHDAANRNKPQLARVVFHTAQQATMQRGLDILKERMVPGRDILLKQLSGLGFS